MSSGSRQVSTRCSDRLGPAVSQIASTGRISPGGNGVLRAALIAQTVGLRDHHPEPSQATPS
jgi:hypothetical protein